MSCPIHGPLSDGKFGKYCANKDANDQWCKAWKGGGTATTAAPRASQSAPNKDRLITRTAIAKSLIESGNYKPTSEVLTYARTWLDWVESRQTDPIVTGEEPF